MEKLETVAISILNMETTRIEQTILKNLIQNEQFTLESNPFSQI